MWTLNTEAAGQDILGTKSFSRIRSAFLESSMTEECILPCTYTLRMVCRAVKKCMLIWQRKWAWTMKMRTRLYVIRQAQSLWMHILSIFIIRERLKVWISGGLTGSRAATARLKDWIRYGFLIIFIISIIKETASVQ